MGASSQLFLFCVLSCACHIQPVCYEIATAILIATIWMEEASRFWSSPGPDHLEHIYHQAAFAYCIGIACPNPQPEDDTDSVQSADCACAVCGHDEFTLSIRFDAVFLHKPPSPFVPNSHSINLKFSPNPRPAVFALCEQAGQHRWGACRESPDHPQFFVADDQSNRWYWHWVLRIVR